MLRLLSRWQVLLAGLLGLRLISMASIPLADTSEPRYAETARLMATNGDWITPWFEPNVPFWGKPPLAFWTEALSFRLFGVTEFAARFPSWLATVATAALIYALGAELLNKSTARWAALVYITCLLPYVAAGAVLTDPFLALGVALSMVSFVLAPKSSSPWWKYGFFLGLAIGLLAKGPLVLVLVGGAVVPWMWWQRNARTHLLALPWMTGLSLTAVLVLPWYIAAEIKTPGFLRYFIVGEHFLRFVDSGWAGDRYGSAHKRPYGSIWIDWILAAFPWSVAAIGLLVARLARRGGWGSLKANARAPVIAYLLCWTAFTPLFFTFSGNILWTYVLPALPAFALLLGISLDRLLHSSGRLAAAAFATAVIPLAGIVLAVVIDEKPDSLKTEKELVDTAYGAAPAPPPSLVYIDSRPFSARFYSAGRADVEPMAQLPSIVMHAPSGLQLAIPREELNQVPASVRSRLQQHFENKRYVLFTVHAGTPSAID